MMDTTLTDFVPSVTVPLGSEGQYAIEKFEIEHDQALRFNMRMAIEGRPEMEVIPGKYTRLLRSKRTVVMSDTISERRDHVEFIENAFGTVLVNGLGIGLVVSPVLRNKKVKKLIIVEKEKDIVDLVAPHYRKKYKRRIHIVHADAFTYNPAARPDVVWNDIWDLISDENVPEMDQLEDKYSDASWVGSWKRDMCEDKGRWK